MRVRLMSVAAAHVLLAACGSSTSAPYGGGGGGCTPTATQVCMVGTAFSPANMTVMHGTTVTWMNGDAITHTVMNASSSTEHFSSGNVVAGATFSHAFGVAGTYNYYCQIHGADGTPPTGMHGTITVQ